MEQSSMNSKFKKLERLDSVKIGYARTSTIEQNLGLKVQIEALVDCSIIFSEHFNI
ncbi:hypothetical protein ACA358_12775 [Enterococcus faecium]|uniref:hypothetical protein n=1 Tax=Enterococcus faecium TaxID=1352 RepID=UPI003BA03819